MIPELVPFYTISFLFSFYDTATYLIAPRGLNHSGNWSTINSNRSSKIKPLWEGGCDDDDICEFADKDDHPAVGSVRVLLQLLTSLRISFDLLLCISEFEI